MTRAFIGLGSNLGDRTAMLRAAVVSLASLEAVAVVGESGVRETKPWGPVEQPDYLNQVVAVDTALAPVELLAELLAIESELGRDRRTEQRYGPRTIDLDLLVFGDEVVSQPGLEVPHPRIAERLFVLEPLAELDPELLVPGHGTAASLLESIRASTATEPLDSEP